MVSKDNKARVSFAPGKIDVYIIVKGDHEEPDERDNGTVYDDLDEAQMRAEWLNWNSPAKQANTYGHPREEIAARRAEARAHLLAAHRALVERERFGPAVAAQLEALRAARAQEEQLAADFARKAQQDGCAARTRKEYQQSAQAAQRRALGLSGKILELEASPVLPSRLAGAGAHEKTDQTQGKEGDGGSAP